MNGLDNTESEIRQKITFNNTLKEDCVQLQKNIQTNLKDRNIIFNLFNLIKEIGDFLNHIWE